MYKNKMNSWYTTKHLIEHMHAKKQMEHEIATLRCSNIVFNQSQRLNLFHG